MRRRDSAEGRPHAILFDWDNTLVDSWAVIHDATNVTLTAFGCQPWTLDETRARVRKSMRDSFPLLFGERWREAAAVFQARFREIHIERLTPIAEAEGALARLKDAGVYLGVVSNKKGDILREEAAHLGWSPYFGRLVGATDATEDKPARAPVELALAGSGIAPGGRVWIAGDADIDMECAVVSGCVPVLVRSEPPAPDEFPDHPPRHHVAGCDALWRLVSTL